MWIIFFLICTLLVVLVPTLPTLCELFYKTDVSALGIEHKYRGNVGHFAESFRAKIIEDRQMPPGTLDPNLTLEMSNPEHENIEPIFLSQKSILLLEHPDTRLPKRLVLNREIYASGNLYVGEGSKVRAILAEGDIVLEQEVSISRWIDAKIIHAGSHCVLYGRASAEKYIELNQGTQFERLNAPMIVIGKKLPTPLSSDSSNQHGNKITPASLSFDNFPKSHKYHLLEKRDTLSESLTIDKAIRHHGNLVVHGTINLPEYSEIEGSIKAKKTLIVQPNCKINGHLIGQDSIEIGHNCEILGNIIAEKSIRIAHGCTLGNLNCPVSIVAPKIIIEYGVMIHGSLSAYEGGHVA